VFAAGRRALGRWALVKLVLLFLKRQEVVHSFDHEQTFQD
jgi:hypothetical protein